MYKDVSMQFFKRIVRDKENEDHLFCNVYALKTKQVPSSDAVTTVFPSLKDNNCLIIKSRNYSLKLTSTQRNQVHRPDVLPSS